MLILFFLCWACDTNVELLRRLYRGSSRKPKVFFFLSSIEHCEKAEGTLFVYFEYPLLLSSRSSTALVCDLARFVTCRLLEYLLEVDMACRDLTVKLNPYIKFKLIKLAITLYQEF